MRFGNTRRTISDLERRLFDAVKLVPLRFTPPTCSESFSGRPLRSKNTGKTHPRRHGAAGYLVCSASMAIASVCDRAPAAVVGESNINPLAGTDIDVDQTEPKPSAYEG